jgi:hypothetical protein
MQTPAFRHGYGGTGKQKERKAQQNGEMSQGGEQNTVGRFHDNTSISGISGYVPIIIQISGYRKQQIGEGV